MIEKIKQRVKAWKHLFAQNNENIDENSTWCEILAEQECYSADKFDAFTHPKWRTAIKTIGSFSREEQDFLEKLPAYKIVRFYLMYDAYRGEFVKKIDGVEVYCMCLAETEDLPIKECTIVTDREDLWGLEIYALKFARYPNLRYHGIIRYAKEPPVDFYVPKDNGDLSDKPF